MGAMGVGGSTKFLSSWALLIAVAKNCGALAVHVIACGVPSLLPVETLRQLGVVLNFPGGDDAWKAPDGSQSRACEVGAGKRIAIGSF
eukprot:919095-Pyramimonas_sp.AAC.1